MCKIDDIIVGLISGVTSGVISGLAILFVDKKWTNQINKVTEENRFTTLKERVLHEIDYNISPGVGGPTAPFLLNAHEELLHHKNIDTVLKDEIKAVIDRARLCNAQASQKNQPGHVKSLSKTLKDKILSLNA